MTIPPDNTLVNFGAPGMVSSHACNATPPHPCVKERATGKTFVADERYFGGHNCIWMVPSWVDVCLRCEEDARRVLWEGPAKDRRCDGG